MIVIKWLFITTFAVVIAVQFKVTIATKLMGSVMQDPSEKDETEWKLLKGDVFRPPRLPMVLSVLIGNGSQLFFTVVLVLGIFNFILIYFIVFDS